MKATIIDVKKETKDICTFTFKPESKLNFIPGQFVMLVVERTDENGEKSKPKRAYSIVNSPQEENIKLTLKIYPNGAVSKTLENMQINSEVEILGPYGKFIYEENNKDVVLIGAGTGIAPFMSMVSHILEKNIKINVTLFFSVKTPSDIIFKEEFDKLNQAHSNFKFIPTITQPNDEPWQGATGRVNKDLLQNNLDNLDKTFYLCGPPDMVNDAQALLLELGVNKEEIKTEKY